MRIDLLTLLIFLTALSCSSEVKKHAINANTSNKMEQEHDSLKYLALGDSYTIGESVETTLRYPVQIADSLKKRGYLVEQHPRS